MDIIDDMNAFSHKKSCFLFVLVALAFFQIAPLVAFDSGAKATQFKALSTITNLAQSATWLNENKLAVGRWDGTITVFDCEDILSIQQVLVPPIKQGITMLERINDDAFVSSNGRSSFTLWERNNEGYVLKETCHFDSRFGAVDSAKFLKTGSPHILLTGHSEGFVLTWEFSTEGPSLLSSISLQSDHPVDSPYKLRNIRSILPWKEGIVITSSEDGDLCMIDFLEGKILHRQRYNQEAKRGINHIFISGDYLLLSNCAVGRGDRNLWLYRIEKNRFVYLDSKNLIENKNLEQVFSFDVGCIAEGKSIHFLCSTQEGLLWFGQIKNDALQISDYKKVSPQGGAVLAIHPFKKRLATVGYDIHLLELQ